MQAALSSSASVADRTRRRVTRRLMPFIFLLYIVAFLDRVNVGFAGLQMTRDLGFSNEVFGFGSGIFFVGYCLLEIPGAMLAEAWSARKWIAAIITAWGLLAGWTGLIHSATQFNVVRFLLGTAEGGFFPAVVVYLTHWYREQDRGKAVAMLFTAAPASQIVGGPLSALLLRVHWLGYPGWRWLLILEGAPALVLGFVTLFYLTDRPQQAAWLRPEERDWLAGELERERGAARPHASVWRALANRHVLLLSAVLFLGLNANYAVGIWLPQMVQRLSTFGVSKVSLVATIPGLVTLPMMLLAGWHSDRTGERIWHAAIPRLLSGAALTVCFFSTAHVWVSVVMLSIAMIGFYSAHPGFWVLPYMFLNRTAAAASIGLINSFGNFGGFLGPYTVGLLSDRTGGFGPGLLYLAFCSFTSGALVLCVRGALARAKATSCRTEPSRT